VVEDDRQTAFGVVDSYGGAEERSGEERRGAERRGRRAEQGVEQR